MSTQPEIPFLVRAARATLSCDRRILYVLFALLIVALNLQLVSLRVPLSISKGAQRLFETIEALPTDKLVLIDNDWGAGNLSECGGQLDATLRHLFARNIRVALITWVPAVEAQKFSNDFARRIGGEMEKQYGVDYVVFSPMQEVQGATISAMARDIIGTVKVDYSSTPLTSLEIMRGVETIRDVSLVLRFAYQWDAIPWIGFIRGPHGTPVAVGAAAITSSTAYPFLDSGQLSGLLAGAAGAAQYEQLVAERYGDLGRTRDGIGTLTVRTQSFAAAYVVLAVLLGNVAYLIDRQFRNRQKEAA